MKKSLLFPLAAIAVVAILAARRPVEARPDAISSASIAVGTKSITTTSAIVTWSKDRYDYGIRTLCYDPAPAAPKTHCVAKEATSSSGSFTITGLAPSTKYNFKITATDPDDGEDPYSTTSNFTTLAEPVAVVRVPGAAPAAAPAKAYDARGRALGGRGAVNASAIFVPGR